VTQDFFVVDFYYPTILSLLSRSGVKTDRIVATASYLPKLYIAR